MISDNYVTGDNIYLRELQNLFFEVLGMMSITHYGAIGDGRTDNYGPIQVAIDDANRRGLSFLYVPYGKFIYTGEFTNLIDPDTGKQRIIFMGNPHAHIVNVRTGEEIEIHQFGWFNGDGNYYTKTEADGKFVKIAGDTMTGSLAIGSDSTASGWISFAQGKSTASGDYSHAEGWSTASGGYSHSEGAWNTASAGSAHAEGQNNTASGSFSHAEGVSNISSSNASHAEGSDTIASGYFSHAGGFHTRAARSCQTAIGIANIEEEGDPAEFSSDMSLLIVGNGIYSGGQEVTRSNAFNVYKNGDVWVNRDVYVGSTSGTHKDAGSKKLATEEYVDTHTAGKSIITGVLNEDYEATSDTNYPIPLTLSESSGTGISIVNNGITIGTGISKVKISGIANIYADTAGVSKLSLYSDNAKVFEISVTMAASSKGTIVIPTYVLPVTNGNVLYMQLSMANGDIVYSGETWLTVEEV